MEKLHCMLVHQSKLSDSNLASSPAAMMICAILLWLNLCNRDDLVANLQMMIEAQRKGYTFVLFYLYPKQVEKYEKVSGAIFNRGEATMVT